MDNRRQTTPRSHARGNPSPSRSHGRTCQALDFILREPRCTGAKLPKAFGIAVLRPYDDDGDGSHSAIIPVDIQALDLQAVPIVIGKRIQQGTVGADLSGIRVPTLDQDQGKHLLGKSKFWQVHDTEVA